MIHGLSNNQKRLRYTYISHSPIARRFTGCTLLIRSSILVMKVHVCAMQVAKYLQELTQPEFCITFKSFITTANLKFE